MIEALRHAGVTADEQQLESLPFVVELTDQVTSAFSE
jgi:hypothetical protein